METGLNWRHPEPAECPAPQSTCPRLGAGSAWASSWRLEARPSSRERLGGRTLALVTPPEALTTGHPLSPVCGLFMGKRKRSLLNSEVLLVSEQTPPCDLWIGRVHAEWTPLTPADISRELRQSVLPSSLLQRGHLNSSDHMGLENVRPREARGPSRAEHGTRPTSFLAEMGKHPPLTEPQFCRLESGAER